MMIRQQWIKIIPAALLLMLVVGLFSPDAFAQASSTPAGTCTTDPSFYVNPPSPGGGLISTIVINIQNILNTVSQGMFLGIVTDGGFIAAVSAVVTLYIAIYGIMFTFGMVQATVFEFAIRMVKIAIIAALLSPSSWAFFSGTVVAFFNGGTDEIITAVTAIATGGVPGGPPFSVLDTAISNAVSAKMAITLIAVFTTPPYGPLIGLLLLMALGSFLKSLLNAMWVYLMSLVLKALLFGIAPIFLACFLFSRTRHIFDGWLNQVVNASLQPILLFTFYSFFAVLITASIGDILSNPACYTESAATLRGTPNTFYKWSFEVMDSTLGQYMPFNGQWTFTGAKGSAKTFPVDIMTVLTLLILAELAGRFNNVVVQVAMDLSGTLTNLSGMQGAFSEMVGGGNAAQPMAGRGLNVPLPKNVGNVADAGRQGTPGVGVRDYAAGRAARTAAPDASRASLQANNKPQGTV